MSDPQPAVWYPAIRISSTCANCGKRFESQELKTIKQAMNLWKHWHLIGYLCDKCEWDKLQELGDEKE